jgi:NTP pyrophosphatase (non-canonical NTP hydrolase)
MELNEYQKQASKTDQAGADPHRGKLIAVLGLGGEAGSLLTEYKKELRDGPAYKIFKERVEEELGDILWYVAALADRENLSLEEIAAKNLKKTSGRWLMKNNAEFSRRKLFDEDYPKHEQLPRKFEVVISEVDGKVKTSCNDKPFGDPLTDNAYKDDGYRYHDVFHLAYAAILGWSPVCRGKNFWKCKRKSNRTTDEVEDGGRSAVIDEAIAALVFEHARKRSFYDGVTTIDYDMLRTIKDLTSHLEVNACSMKEWEQALLEGFRVWREVRAYHGGIVVGDLIERKINYKSL